MIIEEGKVFGINDIDRLDFLQESTVGYGLGWILRPSTTGRGMRLHETSQPDASATVRGAIDQVIRAHAKAYHDDN